MTYTEYVFGGTSGEVVSKKVSEITLDSVAANKDKIAFIRISAQDINANSMITINQPIS
jgi:propanediol dehydratase small subunit